MYKIDKKTLQHAASIIQSGGLVLFPTETVYGIGANALDDNAVKKIFEAKGRKQDNPLILHISHMEMLDEIATEVSEIEYQLMDVFWPGPFTIILKKKKGIASVATCNGNTVAVRMPSNKIAHDLIQYAGVPIAAPSANISGRPSGTKLEDILDELKDKVDEVIDGGECEIGLESTVVRVIDDEVKILRPGKISKEDIQTVIQQVSVDQNVMGQMEEGERVLSPGMKYRHYAPHTHCILVYGEDNKKMMQEMLHIAKSYTKPLIVTTNENIDQWKGFEVLKLGSKDNLLEISHNLFSTLRKIDELDVDVAIIEGVETEGIGLAIMNRLIRACEHDYRKI